MPFIGDCDSTMRKVLVVTDSTSDITKEIAEKYSITVVPLNVHMDKEVYKDQVTISSDEFFEKLPKCKNLPRTSQPSPGEFIEVYRSLLGEADSIISIHISEEMSGTLQSARIATQSIPEADISIIDSRSVCMGLGLVVIEAAKAAAEGKDKTEVLRIIEEAKKNVRVIFVVDTLDYLEKNGRIGKAQAFLGSLLSIKPVLAVQDGIIIPVEKMRGSKKALSRLVEIAREEVKGNFLGAAIVHGAAFGKLTFVRDGLQERFSETDLILGSVGPVIGVHAGPGVLGLMYFVK